MMSHTIIEIKQLTKKYGDFTAVDQLSLTIDQGEIFGLLGPNGAGKTTSILMMLGMTEPSSGTVTVAGYDATRSPLEVKKKVGYLADNVGFYDYLNGLDNLSLIGELNGLTLREAKERAKDLLVKVGLEDAMYKKTATYSRGMKQRLGLADVLIKSPEVIILDEPTLGIDPSGVRDFLALIKGLSREQGLTVLLSSHHLHQVQQVCDRVGIFVGGKLLVQGEIASLSRQLFDQGGYTTEVTVSDSSPDALGPLLERIRAMPEVLDITIDQQHILFSTTTDMTAILVRTIVLEGIDVLKVQQKEYGLDEIYQQYFESTNEKSIHHEKSFPFFRRIFFHEKKKS